MTPVKAIRRIVKFRVVNPKNGKIVGYERLMLTEAGTAWQFSLDDKEWEAGIFEGDDRTRDQGTGIINEDKREIYENDIVARGMRTNTVTYQQGKFGMKERARKWAFPDGPGIYPLSYKLRVVGTIHTNPELLEGNGEGNA